MFVAVLGSVSLRWQAGGLISVHLVTDGPGGPVCFVFCSAWLSRGDTAIGARQVLLVAVLGVLASNWQAG